MSSTAGAFRTVEVGLGERAYQVEVGPGVRRRLSEKIPRGARRAAVITQEGVNWPVSSGLDQTVLTVPDGEEAKSLSQVQRLCERLAAEGFTRRDVIVAVGGGVVTDLAGFVAAVYHRGVRYVSVPTTLLAQVDAAIGGKTGVNLPQGKNLVGAFWQPGAVLCDTEVLATLPAREMRSGKGELAKYHFIGSGRLDGLSLQEQIVEAVRIKAAVVSEDERESGRRVVLNYGHTLAHAVETAGLYDMRHGEAVAVGLVYAAEVALRLGRIDEARVHQHRRVVAAHGLDARLPQLDHDELLALFRRDKKSLTDITMVLDSADGLAPVTGIPETVLRAAFGALR